MSETDEPTRAKQTLEEESEPRESLDSDGPAYYMPCGTLRDEEARQALDTGSESEKAAVVSNLLSYALWDDIWARVERDQVVKLFPALELPDSLRRAWARTLGIDESGQPRS
ncbi:MAG: hypothetical protein AAF725_19505 [Acidobacteriota bacterium]